MILHEITGTEQHSAYEQLEAANGSRQYSFLASIIQASLTVDRAFLSSTVIKALNFHAIACMHTNAGEYRPCPVSIMTGDIVNHEPPAHFRVGALMDDFVNMVNRQWDRSEPVVLAAFVLWRINFIHPFINGNGRTARAAAYFVLCLKLGGMLPGDTALPELLRQNRPRYVAALAQVDASLAGGALDLVPLVELIDELLAQQLGPVLAAQADAGGQAPG
ncbi:Fic family protein [Roseateles sp.]|uniref:Fic family protein n=1 Tax=Roseateles sp. TaxID=1971397 RepID=UPI003D0C4E58